MCLCWCIICTQPSISASCQCFVSVLRVSTSCATRIANVDEVLREVCLEIAQRYEITFLETGIDGDHVHFLVQSVPTYSATKIVRTIKRLTSKEVLAHCPQVKKKLWGGQFAWWRAQVSALGFGSSLPVQQTQRGLIVGAVVAAVLLITICAYCAYCAYYSLDFLLSDLIPLLFITVVVCGAHGGAERQRNGHGNNDGELFGVLGVGLLCALLPCIGFLLTVSLSRSGNNKSTAALVGTILGFVTVGRNYST